MTCVQLQEAALSSDEITRGLNTQLLAKRVVYFECVRSTNDIAKQLADDGELEGTIVVADEQTAGRGRFERTWVAPPRSSILLSLILRPKLTPHQIARVTMAVTLGARDAIRSETDLEAQIKWPNDILLSGKKCAGILTESKTVGDDLEYMIVGLGVNVNFSVVTVAGLVNATTIAEELGHSVRRAHLLQSILKAIEKYYLRLVLGENLAKEWSDASATLGQPIRIQTPWGEEQGIAEKIDDDGALYLRRANGSLARLIEGEITLAGARV